MDRAKLLRELDRERRQLVRDGESIRLAPNVTRLASADGSHQTVIYTSLNSTNADETIDEQIAYYQQLGTAFEWKLYAHDTPADLLQRLGGKGFTIGAREAVLVLDLAQPRRWVASGIAVRVSRVDRIEDVGIYQQVAEAAIGKDYSVSASELAAAIHAGSTQHRGYIGYVGDVPVSVGRLYSHPDSQFGGLYGGATIPAFRGRGVYRAIISARAHDALELGATYLTVDALPTSEPILNRLGFQKISETWPCHWSPHSA